MYCQFFCIIMLSTRNYRNLNTKKRKAIEAVEEAAEKQGDIAVQFQVGRSTLLMILKKKQKNVSEGHFLALRRDIAQVSFQNSKNA